MVEGNESYILEHNEIGDNKGTKKHKNIEKGSVRQVVLIWTQERQQLEESRGRRTMSSWEGGK